MMRRWYYRFLFIGVGIWLFSLGGLSACAKPTSPPATQPTTPGVTEKEVVKEKEVIPTQPSTPTAKPTPSVTQKKEKSVGEIEPALSLATINVKMSGFLFDSAMVSIAGGTTVIWTNNDSVSHTVTAKEALFDSGNLSRGATFSYTFSQNGTFEYYCKIHPSMKGKVVVGETSVSQTEPSSGQSPDY